MASEEDEIRRVVSTWLAATKAGDVEKVLSLMADDAVFLVAGHPPMSKSDFADAARAQAGSDSPRFDGESEIQEITIAGEWAFLWQKLTVVTTPRNGAPSTTRTGHTLTIFRMQDGKWVLARDANMLAPVESDAREGAPADADSRRG